MSKKKAKSKKVIMNATVTPEALDRIDAVAEKLGQSRSGLLELISQPEHLQAFRNSFAASISDDG